MNTEPHWLITTAMREPDNEKAQACADAFKPLGELAETVARPMTPADYAAQIVQLRIQLADYSQDSETVKRLKRELREFNIHTGCWSDK